MAVVVIGWDRLLNFESLVISFLLSLALGVAVYVGLMWVLNIPELLGMARTVGKKIKKQ